MSEENLDTNDYRRILLALERRIDEIWVEGDPNEHRLNKRVSNTKKTISKIKKLLERVEMKNKIEFAIEDAGFMLRALVNSAAKDGYFLIGNERDGFVLMPTEDIYDHEPYSRLFFELCKYCDHYSILRGDHELCKVHGPIKIERRFYITQRELKDWGYDDHNPILRVDHQSTKEASENERRASK